MIDDVPNSQAGLERLAPCRDLKVVPLPECGCPDVRGREHETSAVVMVKSKIVFECVSAHHVVAALGESENDTSRGVLATGYRLEADRHSDGAVRPAGREDYVVFIVCGALPECSLAPSATRHAPAHPVPS